uniref:Uncharacterized protein n=1 Tax=Anopheles coluzzii TaxID=1518534 RepID=A0A8W7PJH4_ANOCL
MEVMAKGIITLVVRDGRSRPGRADRVPQTGLADRAPVAARARPSPRGGATVRGRRDLVVPRSIVLVHEQRHQEARATARPDCVAASGQLVRQAGPGSHARQAPMARLIRRERSRSRAVFGGGIRVFAVVVATYGAAAELKGSLGSFSNGGGEKTGNVSSGLHTRAIKSFGESKDIRCGSR